MNIARPFVIDVLGTDHTLWMELPGDEGAVYISNVNFADTIPEPNVALRMLQNRQDQLNDAFALWVEKLSNSV